MNANTRIAKWQKAHTLRLLGRIHEASPILEKLQDEYESIEKNGKLDMPIEMFKLARGWVYEELAEIHDAQAKKFAGQDFAKTHASLAKKFASLAYADLSQDPIFSKTEVKRLERLKNIQK